MKSILLLRSWKVFVFALAAVAHLILILTITINTGEKEKRQDNSIFKMVDIKEYIPPEPVKDEPPKAPPPKKINPDTQVEVSKKDVAEEIIETEKEVIEVEEVAADVEAIEFLPQHKISDPPGIPTSEILSRIEYPVLANKQKIEGVVYLELYIDQKGNIRNIDILKDPGYGLADAALEALEGIVCRPALANGNPVAVRFRYPVRFKLK